MWLQPVVYVHACIYMHRCAMNGRGIHRASEVVRTYVRMRRSIYTNEHIYRHVQACMYRYVCTKRMYFGRPCMHGYMRGTNNGQTIYSFIYMHAIDRLVELIADIYDIVRVHTPFVCLGTRSLIRYSWWRRRRQYCYSAWN